MWYWHQVLPDASTTLPDVCKHYLQDDDIVQVAYTVTLSSGIGLNSLWNVHFDNSYTHSHTWKTRYTQWHANTVQSTGDCVSYMCVTVS